MRTVILTLMLLVGAAVLLAGGAPSPVLPEVEHPQTDQTFSVIETQAELPDAESLLGFLEAQDAELNAMCGGQCGDGTCICSGSDDCCDDLCNYGCSLCSSPPCVVIAEDVEADE